MKGYNPRDCLKDGSAIAAAICITVIALIITFLATDANNRPAWIQAIGSISAIILAFLIATFQSERNLIQARQLRIDEKKENINKLSQIIELSYFHYNEIIKTITIYETQDRDDDIFINIDRDWISYKNIISYLKKVDWMSYTHDEVLVNIFTYLGMHESNIMYTEYKARTCFSSTPKDFNPAFIKVEDATVIYVSHALANDSSLRCHFVNYEDISAQYQKIIDLLKNIKINS